MGNAPCLPANDELVGEYKRVRMRQLKESMEIWDAVWAKRDWLDTNGFDEVFGHILLDSELHYKLFAREVQQASHKKVASGNEGGGYLRHTTPSGAKTISKAVSPRSQMLSAMYKVKNSLSFAKAVAVPAVIGPRVLAVEFMCIVALIGDTGPVASALHFIFSLFGNDDLVLCKQSPKQFAAMVSCITLAVWRILGKAEPENVKHEIEKRIPSLFEPTGETTFAKFWESLSDDVDCVEYMDAILAMRSSPASLQTSRVAPLHTPHNAEAMAALMMTDDDEGDDDEKAMSSGILSDNRPALFVTSGLVKAASVPAWWDSVAFVNADTNCASALKTMLEKESHALAATRAGVCVGVSLFSRVVTVMIDSLRATLADKGFTFAELIVATQAELAKASTRRHASRIRFSLDSEDDQFGNARPSFDTADHGINQGCSNMLQADRHENIEAFVAASLNETAEGKCYEVATANWLLASAQPFHWIDHVAQARETHLAVISNISRKPTDVVTVANSSDFLRLLHRHPDLLHAWWFAPLERFPRLRQPAKIAPESSVLEAIDLLDDKHIRCVALVATDQVFTGSLNRDTVRRAIATKVRQASVKVEDGNTLGLAEWNALLSSRHRGSSVIHHGQDPHIRRRELPKCDTAFVCAAMANILIRPILSLPAHLLRAAPTLEKSVSLGHAIAHALADPLARNADRIHVTDQGHTLFADLTFIDLARFILELPPSDPRDRIPTTAAAHDQ